MPRLTSLLVTLPAFFAFGFVLAGGVYSSACSDSMSEGSSISSFDAGSLRRDAAPVEPLDAASVADADVNSDTPSCSDYCDRVMANCTGPHAQYGSRNECLAFCTHLPLGGASTDDLKSAPTVACREYWADAPSKTDPAAYCAAAGPFGGNRCGDRCTAFCSVLLSTCASGSAQSTYASQPDCATDCAGFAYHAAGGDGPYGPDGGGTLNCRLYLLRRAVADPSVCVELAPSSSACK